MTEYNAGANSQEFYLYDASGNRVLKRTISGGTTSLTAYAFGLQELTYTGSGASTGQTDYYAIAGHLIGSTNGSATTYDLTDAEGSVLTSLSSSAVLGEQTYGPYGNQRYTQGSMGTDKGYTGQFQDAVSGFDYYNARYYDPVMGQFLSADHVQSNAQGMDPYSYVNGNPETATDPTGQAGVCAWCGETGIAGGSTAASGGHYPTAPTCPSGEIVTGTSCSTPGIKGSGPNGREPSGGGGGSGGGHCCGDAITGPKVPAQPQLQKQTAAQHLATYEAHDAFDNLSNAFGIISLILVALAGLALGAPFIGDFWAFVLAGAAAGFATLALVAAGISGDFLNERDNALSWFTTGNLEAEKSNMIGSITHGFDSILGALAGVLSAVGSFLGFKIPAVEIPPSSGDLGSPDAVRDLSTVPEGTAENLGRRVGGMGFLIADVLVYIGGATLLTYEVNSYTSQQEQLLSGN